MARLPTLVGSLVGWMEQKQEATFKQSTVRFASLEHELTKDPMAARILHQDHCPQNIPRNRCVENPIKKQGKIFAVCRFVAHNNNIRWFGYSVGHDQD